MKLLILAIRSNEFQWSVVSPCPDVDRNSVEMRLSAFQCRVGNGVECVGSAFRQCARPIATPDNLMKNM